MSDRPFNRAEVILVIRTTLETRGSGDSLADPVRRVTQYWSFDGELLWEDDPCADPKKPSTETKHD